MGTTRTEAAGAPAETFSGAATATAALPVSRRGRHRRPRSRKALFAAGGLALAVGVLSLVRMAPESGIGAPGAAEAEPRLGPGGTGRPAANTAATVGTLPTALPSATSVMGGVSATPALSTASRLPTGIPTTIPTAAPRTTHGRAAPGTKPTLTPATTPAAPRPVPPPTPTPAPSRSTPAPEPRPSRPPGVCVPVIGLCVDPPRAPRGRGLVP